ncbi:MAG TPA: universal stress protein [Solirubrobacteraceae bacterium]|nr:universal stress protein [Solirubrobacteraceae bacterium]
MSNPILVAHDPESADPGVVDFAGAAAELTGAPVVLLVVRAGGSQDDRMSGGEMRDDGASDAGAGGPLLERLTAKGIAAEVRVVANSSAARGIAAAVDELAPRLVVVGSTGRGRLGRVLPGSTAERVIHGAAAPVAVVPHGYELPAEGVRTIGAAFLPSPEGRAALRAAADLARRTGGRVRAVMVLDPKHADEGSGNRLATIPQAQQPGDSGSGVGRLRAEDELDRAIAELAEGVDVEPDVLFQPPVEGLEAASTTLDLLVMGSRAYGPMHAVMLGGVSRRVLASAACPVLVLPRGVESLAGAPAGSRPPGAAA